MSNVSIPSAASMIRYDDELKRRLEKLSRTYDLTTMKIFICVECLGKYHCSFIYSRLSLSRPRLSRITAYLEVKVWAQLFKASLA